MGDYAIANYDEFVHQKEARLGSGILVYVKRKLRFQSAEVV